MKPTSLALMSLSLFLVGCNPFTNNSTETAAQPLPEFSLQCQTDADCQSITSTNTCQVFCANTTAVNQAIVDGLPVSCSAEAWNPASINCLCIENTCTSQAQ